jgi:hypothetical protein
MLKELKSSLSKVPFKNNKVRMAGGVETSDLERKSAVMDAIESDLQRIGKSVFNVTFSALEKNFEESHIGIYYEHGTGEEWDGRYESVKSGYKPNPHRSGRTIVSRSRHIDYSGNGKGKWVDLRGNIRITGSGEAGVHNKSFVKYIGEDTKAYHWYSNVFKNNHDWIMNRLRQAIHNVELTNFLHLRKKKYILGKDMD